MLKFTFGEYVVELPESIEYEYYGRKEVAEYDASEYRIKHTYAKVVSDVYESYLKTFPESVIELLFDEIEHNHEEFKRFSPSLLFWNAHFGDVEMQLWMLDESKPYYEDGRPLAVCFPKVFIGTPEYVEAFLKKYKYTFFQQVILKKFFNSPEFSKLTSLVSFFRES